MANQAATAAGRQGATPDEGTETVGRSRHTRGAIAGGDVAAALLLRPRVSDRADEVAASFVVRSGAERRLTYRASKWMVEATISLVTLALLSPLLLVIAVLVRLDSPGPVIHRQQRLRGRLVRRPDGCAWVAEPFTMLKIRTMVADADDGLHRDYMDAYLSRDDDRLRQLNPDRDPGGSYRPAADPRVTRVGAVLRRLSLDELPQLWNVIRGDIALVGPRPPMAYETTWYAPHERLRLACPSGITGLAQVHGRSGLGCDDLFALDLEYVGRRNLWVDLKILLLTVPAVLSMRGAD